MRKTFNVGALSTFCCVEMRYVCASVCVSHFILPSLSLTLSLPIHHEYFSKFVLFSTLCLYHSLFRRCDFQPDYIDEISECQQCTHIHMHTRTINGDWWMWVVFFYSLILEMLCTRAHLHTCIETERTHLTLCVFAFYFIGESALVLLDTTVKWMVIFASVQSGISVKCTKQTQQIHMSQKRCTICMYVCHYCNDVSIYFVGNFEQFHRFKLISDLRRRNCINSIEYENGRTIIRLSVRLFFFFFISIRSMFWIRFKWSLSKSYKFCWFPLFNVSSSAGFIPFALLPHAIACISF